MPLNTKIDAIEQQAKLFHGFADPSRLAILEALRDGPHTVGEIVVATGLSQPNVSNHLACLRDCGLVNSRPAGRFAFYQLSHSRIDRLLRLADEILASPGITLDHPPSQRVPER
jgi:DNA-binding transcriptional ArsR family regulator